MKAIGVTPATLILAAAAYGQQPVTIAARQTMQLPAFPSLQAQPIPSWKAPDHVGVVPIPNWGASEAPPVEPIPSWHMEASPAYATSGVLTRPGACVIVQDDGKRCRFVEGMLPEPGKVPQKFAQNDIQKIIESGGRVVFLGAHYTPSDLAAARQTCQ